MNTFHKISTNLNQSKETMTQEAKEAEAILDAEQA